jgi:hypothetical protein
MKEHGTRYNNALSLEICASHRIKQMYNLKGDMQSGKKCGQVSALDVYGR